MLNKLRYWLKPINAIFRDFNEYTLDADDITMHRIFIDRGSSVLFVAHLDTICKPKFYRKTNKRIYASGLDDRLGCLAAYELSKQLNVDLLFTDREESGQTTIACHDCTKYNWIVEFDRRGDDVVTYECDNKEFRDALSEFWKIGIGSYSDIMSAETNSCCFNLGIGIKHEHSKNSYMTIKTFYKQIEKFKQFYSKYKDIQFVRDFQIMDDVIDYYCELCGINDGKKIYSYCICKDCLRMMLNQYFSWEQYGNELCLRD